MLEDFELYTTLKVKCLVYQQKISGDLYLMLCGVEDCLPDYYFNAAGRDGYHLHVVLKGRGVLSVNGRETEIHFGQMFITKPGEDTWYRADSNDPWTYCWMTFGGRLAKECAEEAGFIDGVNVLDCHVDHRLFYTIVTNALNQAELHPSNVYYRTGLLLEYISTAVDSYSTVEKRSRKQNENMGVDYVKYAADFIFTNYATAKISDVARYVGLHRSYLTNLFKAKMGISPQEYLMQCRMKQACKLLKETNNPIQEIAFRVGYDNPLTFSKTFKGFYGYSPREYRNKNR